MNRILAGLLLVTVLAGCGRHDALWLKHTKKAEKPLAAAFQLVQRGTSAGRNLNLTYARRELRAALGQLDRAERLYHRHKPPAGCQRCLTVYHDVVHGIALLKSGIHKEIMATLTLSNASAQSGVRDYRRANHLFDQATAVARTIR